MKRFDIRKWNMFQMMYAYLWVTFILIMIIGGIVKIIEAYQ